MAESPVGSQNKLGFLSGIMLFVRQIVGELKKVVTPTRKELVRYTAVVLMFVVIMMVIVTLLDLGFGSATAFIFGGGSGDS